MGCRTCNITNNQQTDLSYNYLEHARFQQHTDKQLLEIEQQQSKAYCYHSMAGKACTFLDITMNALSKAAKALKLAFSTVMTESIYQELQELLTKENNLLLQALRHIIDGWIDPRFNNTTALSKLALDSHINSIFSNWYAIENAVLYLEDEDKNNDN
ncbi:9671_t:CDS:2, partial [Dentiscutata erythropus]